MDPFTDESWLLPPIDARLVTPFNMIVNGPTGAGKSTFVASIMDPNKAIFTSNFKYILLFLGTTKANNSMAQQIEAKHGSKCSVYENVFLAVTIDNFPQYLEEKIEQHGGAGGLLIFDDLMVEVAESGVLVPLFTKICAHGQVSTILITQNIFHKVGGKNGRDGTTLYRNTSYLVLFKSPMDNTTIDVVARKLQPSGFKDIAAMINYVVSKHRYIMIDGKQNTPNCLKFRSNIAGEMSREGSSTNEADTQPLHQLAFVREVFPNCCK